LAQGSLDLSSAFVVADLSTDGRLASRSIIYLEPTKLVQLLPAAIHSELTQDGSGYRLKLTSPVLARDVYVTFGDEDVKVSDNYIDLLPGEPQTLSITGSASLSTLKQQMKVISLVDAFSPEAAASTKSEK
jgi:beta-mannosidase